MKLQTFRYFNRPTVIEPARTQIVMPSFTLSVPIWAGASDILAEYPLLNDYSLSLLLPIDLFGENFIAAVRWLTDDDIWARYILFEHDDAVLNYPLYNGERIGPNAVFEIWSVDSLEAPILDDDYVFWSSILVFPVGEASNSSCSSVCCNAPSSVITLVVTPPSELPPGSACNPFCGNLCNTAPPMPTCECPNYVVNNIQDGRDYEPDVFVSPFLLFVLGGSTPGDGLGKQFYWDSASLAVDTGLPDTTVIRPTSLTALDPGRWLQYI